MKKVFALLMIAGVFAMASCGKKEQAAEATTDSAAVAPAETAAPAATDSAAASTDTTKAATDSAAAAPAAH